MLIIKILTSNITNTIALIFYFVLLIINIISLHDVDIMLNFEDYDYDECILVQFTRKVWFTVLTSKNSTKSELERNIKLFKSFSLNGITKANYTIAYSLLVDIFGKELIVKNLLKMNNIQLNGYIVR